MAASILTTYLRLNLLELGGDDTRLHKLGAAASELADTFARAPREAIPVFLASLKTDPNSGTAFDEVAKAIENHWATYIGAFKDGTPTTLYKAVTLQALVEAIDIQPVLGTAISLLMRNFGPYLEVGKNKAALDILVHAADTAFEAEYAESMGHTSAKTLVAPIATKPSKVSRADLKKRIEAAVGPSNRQGQPGAEPNPHNPQTNGTAWAYDFSDRLTEILADYTDAATKWASEMDAKNLRATGDSVEDFVNAPNPINQSSIALLWWRQALFSESAAQPYRALPLLDAVVHAVVDLSRLIPPAYQRALESFLLEAILSIAPSPKGIVGSELQKIAPGASSSLNNGLESGAPPGLLVSAIIHDDAAFAHLQISLAPSKWAVWLLRELKAMQALEHPKPVPEKAKKNNE